MSSVGVVQPQTGLKKRRMSRNARKTLDFCLFVSPWVLGFIFLWIIPLTLGIATSLSNYDGLNLATVKFVGLRNYTRAFSDPDTRYAFTRTLLWAVFNLPTWMGASFLMALILNQNIKAQGLFRTLYYLPSVVPLVATMWIWKIFLDQNYGLFNAFLSVFRPGTAIPWLSTYALLGLAAIAIWSGLGWGMVVFLAGLQGVPEELVEAARIDGANTLRVFRHVTIPLVTPVIFFVLINGLVGAFQQLAFPLLFTTSNSTFAVPPRPVYLYMVHAWLQIMSKQRYGYGTALLWLIFIFVAVITVVVFWTQRYWVHTEVSQEEKR